jgi:hypothetical protein
MSEMVGRVQDHFKRTTGGVGLFFLRLVSGAVLGLTFALIMQEVLGLADGQNLLTFLLVIITTTGIFLRLSKVWGLTGLMIFDLIAVLLGLVLRLYIIVAPGA